jgi:hypothetical protein
MTSLPEAAYHTRRCVGPATPGASPGVCSRLSNLGADTSSGDDPHPSLRAGAVSVRAALRLQPSVLLILKKP